MKAKADISYAPTGFAGSTPEQACDARARAWAYVFDCINRRESKEGGPATALHEGERSSNKFASTKNRTKPPNVLGLVRELYSRMPETRTLEAYELRVTLWLLHYTDELLDEAEIAAAFEALRIEGEVLP